MISEELLSEVFGREVSEIKNTCTDKEIVIIAYFDGFRQAFTMNIYELAFKCKEWAFWNDYEIITRMRIPDIYRDKHKIDYGYEINHISNGLVKAFWWINTEPEAIFEACEWILKEMR